MKKTVTANISGTVFHIEEDAFLKLGRYLDSIRAKFTGTDGREEIMADIEARIAELFHQRLEGRNVVSIADVEHVIGVMGQPEDYAGEEESAGTSTNATGNDPTRTAKRLFRDPDDKWVGGVLSGLAAYIGMEALWARIGFLVLCIPFMGTLFLVYILMWILVPKAESAADRLQMRGEPVNVDNIKRVFEEGGERFKRGAEHMANEAHEFGKQWEPKAKAWGHEAANTARRTGRSVGTVLSKVIGIGLIIASVAMLMFLISGAVGIGVAGWTSMWGNGNVGSMDLGGLLFDSQNHAFWLVICGLLVLAIPVIGLLIAGFHLLMDTRAPRWLGWTLVLVWVVSLIASIALGVGLAQDFRQSARNRTEATLQQPTGRTIHLGVMPGDTAEWQYNVAFDDGDLHWEHDGLSMDNGMVRGGWADCDVERSPDSLFHLIVVRQARGIGEKEAAARASHIEHAFHQQGDTLFLSSLLSFPATDKLRFQDLDFTLQVPYGGSVHFMEGAQHVIHDVDNVHHIWDGNMINRTWTMTSKGLLDLKAPTEEDEYERDHEEDRKLRNEQLKQEADSLRAQQTAAIVFRKPAPKKSVVPQRATASVTAEAPALAIRMPDILNVLPFLR